MFEAPVGSATEGRDTMYRGAATIRASAATSRAALFADARNPVVVYALLARGARKVVPMT